MNQKPTEVNGGHSGERGANEWESHPPFALPRDQSLRRRSTLHGNILAMSQNRKVIQLSYTLPANCLTNQTNLHLNCLTLLASSVFN